MRSCFSCRMPDGKGLHFLDDNHPKSVPSSAILSRKTNTSKCTPQELEDLGKGNISAETFTYEELCAATQNFSPEALLGEGGFGKVYKGYSERKGMDIAVKKLNRNGLQGNYQFVVEVLMLSLLHHPNLVNLVGYCTEGQHRLLVYEYLSNGCLEEHLLDLSEGKKPLSWYTRMKIAEGAARGLEYLHEIAKPPVIYRDFKSSNILLDKNFKPRLSDFGLAKLGPVDGDSYVSTRVMGTYGYCAPEYVTTGRLTKKSDIYSFGVVLLEIISGRRVIDPSKPSEEQNLITWAKPMFRNKQKFHLMADPLLEGNYPQKGLYQALAIAAMCLQEDDSARPMISDVVTALEYVCLNSQPQDSSEEENQDEEVDEEEEKRNQGQAGVAEKKENKDDEEEEEDKHDEHDADKNGDEEEDGDKQ